MSKGKTDTTTTQPAEQGSGGHRRGAGMYGEICVAISCHGDGGDGSTVNEQQSRAGQLTYRCGRR